MIPSANILWTAALLASMTANLWVVLTRAQVQTTLSQERADRERERADAAGSGRHCLAGWRLHYAANQRFS